MLSAALDEHRVGHDRARRVHAHPVALVRRADGAAGSSTSTLPCFPNIAGSTRMPGRIEAGDTVSGCSVHLVTEELDAGEVLGQAEVPIEPGDTPESLERRVLAAEHELYPKVLSEFVKR